MARPNTAAVRLLAGEREPVRVATTANIGLSGLQTIDGIALVAGERVLVKDQTDQSNNGIYETSSGVWYRAGDARQSRTMNKGTSVRVQSGSVNGGKGYEFVTLNPVIGEDAITVIESFSLDAIQEFVQAAQDAADAAISSTLIGEYATRTNVTAATIPVAKVFLRVAGDTAAGDGGSALFKRVSTEPSHAGKVRSVDRFMPDGSTNTTYGGWWVIAEAEIDPRMVGAKFDDATDDGAAINAAIGIGLPIKLPKGIARSSVSINVTVPFRGAGWGLTEIKFTTAGSRLIAPFGSSIFHISDFRVTSTLAASARTVPGVEIQAGALVMVERVRSSGHLYGFVNLGQGNEYINCFAENNHSHGFILDASVQAQNEIGLYFCQANGNGDNGFHIIGNTAGIFLVRPTAFTNGNDGIKLVNPGTLVGTSAGHVYIVMPELGLNGDMAINMSDNLQAQFITISGGLIEAQPAGIGIYVGLDVRGVTITGMMIAGQGTGILCNGAGTSITGNFLGGNGIAIHLGANSKNVTIGPNATTEDGFGPNIIGIKIDVGATAFTHCGFDFAGCTTPVSGAIPAGSIGFSRGFAEMRLPVGWTSNADAAVNGYAIMVDKDGVARKFATIA